MFTFPRAAPLFCLLLAQALPGRATGPVLTMQLRPTYAQPGQANGFAVAYTLTAPSAQPRPLDLQFDLLAPSLVRTTDQVMDLVVTDAKGKVPLVPPVVRKEAGEEVQHWLATRPVVGTIHVAYRVPVAPAVAPKRGLHIDLQAAGGGLAGGGRSFLLLPEVAVDSLRLSWQLPVGATAVSSYGPGRQVARTTVSKLNEAHFLAGPLYHYPTQPTEQGFSAYRLGKTAAEMDAPLAWPSRPA